MKQNLKMKERGITLIALVITIIILLILAAVTIAALSGDNGILSNAAKAKRETEIAEIIEQIRLELYGEMADNGGTDPTEAEIETIADKYGDIIGETFADKVLKTEKGNYEIKLSDIWTAGSSTEDTIDPPIPSDSLQPGEIATADKNEYYDGEATRPAKIPEGFTVSNVEGEKTINGGLVIYYIPEGTDTSGDFWTADSDDDGSPDVQENYDQYVWIPVDGILDEDGTIADVDGTNGEKKVLLGRYDFDYNSGKALKVSMVYKEDAKESHDSKYKNKPATDIDDFIQSVRDNYGYYIGRYEAGVIDYDNLVEDNNENNPDWTGYSGENIKLVSKRGVQPWNYVTQNRASVLCQNLYEGVNSDLVNSYAWDTAILFIQNEGTESNSGMYSKQKGKGTSILRAKGTGTGVLADTMKTDKQCNIYDMAGNCYEWTTETYSNLTSSSCVRRGGNFNSNYYPNYRVAYEFLTADSAISFRSIIYF